MSFDGFDQHVTEESKGAKRLLARIGLADASPAVVAGVLLLLVMALGVAGWRLGVAATGGQTGDGIVFEAGASNGEVLEDGSSAPEETGVEDAAEVSATLWVHVAGFVNRPGVYELPAGSRVAHAIRAAGEASEDGVTDAVNLARSLADGEQVYVPSREEVESGLVAAPHAAAAGAGESAQGGAGGAVDINTATEGELVALPGVGPATAGKIVADREANGPFASPEDIMRVSGIGEKKFEAMRDLIVVR